MASESAGEKSEPPTPRRRTEARGKGQVAKSQELSAAVLLLSALVALTVFGPHLWMTLLSVTRAALGGESTDLAVVLTFCASSAVRVAKAVAPLFVVAFLVAFIVLYSQVGWLFTLEPLMPKLGKLNPINGVKRLFSPHSLVMLGQNVLKLALVTAVGWLSVKSVIAQIVLAHSVDYTQIFGLGASVVFYVGIRIAVVMLLLAILDYFYQRHRHEKQLKMSKEEVKEEMKRMDGDPVMKRRRREAQLQLSLQRLKKSVPQADVVVTNPTHFAVALRYDSETMSAPKVVAKGADFLALRIREIAAAFSVPIVERPELARMLYREVEVGQETPERLFRAVAEVLAYVYELGNRRMGPMPLSTA